MAADVPGAPVPGRPGTVRSDDPGTPVSDDPRALAQLGEALRRVGFTHDRTSALLGGSAMAALERDQAVPALRVLEPVLEAPGHPDRGLAGVVVLFLLGRTVPAALLGEALDPVGPERLRALGLVEDTEGGLRATVDLRPHASDAGTELYVASDLGAAQRPGVLRRDHVLGIGQASLTLAQITDRRPVGRALDLGTGCGVQTFHLLAHAEHVTATDVSDRALRFTRFNLLLNAQALGIDPQRLEDRVSLRAGSLLGPVRGEQFDLVVSNPPFVITPRPVGERHEDRFTYRDGGLPGDRIVEDLVRELPGVLAPGATAHLLGNWEVPAPGSGDERAVADRWMLRPQSWVPETADTWWIQRELLSPEEYAETWLRDAAEARDEEHYERAYRAYLDDFASRGVEAVGFGLIRLRRPSARRPGAGPLRRFEDVPHAVQQPLAPALAATWDRADWLAGHPEDWLDARFVVAEDVTEERHQRPGAEHPGVILLRQGAGLRRTAVLSSEAAGFAGVCDGELSARQILAALGGLLGWAGEEPQRVADEVRHLVLDGFLVPEATA